MVIVIHQCKGSIFARTESVPKLPVVGSVGVNLVIACVP